MSDSLLSLTFGDETVECVFIPGQGMFRVTLPDRSKVYNLGLTWNGPEPARFYLHVGEKTRKYLVLQPGVPRLYIWKLHCIRSWTDPIYKDDEATALTPSTGQEELIVSASIQVDVETEGNELLLIRSYSLADDKLTFTGTQELPCEGKVCYHSYRWHIRFAPDVHAKEEETTVS